MLLAFLIGLVFGFFGSMPVAGPTAVVLVSKGLENHLRAGIYIAVGAAVAESAYAFMAFWGLTAVFHSYPFLLPASRLVGAALLLLLGIYFLLRKPKEPRPLQGPDAERVGLRNVLFGFSLTAVNPILLVTWTAAVGVAHSAGILRVDESDAFPFAGGAILGIVGWFGILLELLSRFRSLLSPKVVQQVIRWMGVLLIVIGLGLAVRSIALWNVAG